MKMMTMNDVSFFVLEFCVFFIQICLVLTLTYFFSHVCIYYHHLCHLGQQIQHSKQLPGTFQTTWKVGQSCQQLGCITFLYISFGSLCSSSYQILPCSNIQLLIDLIKLENIFKILYWCLFFSNTTTKIERGWKSGFQSPYTL